MQALRDVQACCDDATQHWFLHWRYKHARQARQMKRGLAPSTGYASPSAPRINTKRMEDVQAVDGDAGPARLAGKTCRENESGMVSVNDRPRREPTKSPRVC